MAVLTIDCEPFQKWLTEMQEKGLVPPETRRIVIDAPLSGIVKVYYEANLDPRILSPEFALMLKDCATPVHAKDAKDSNGG